MLNQEQHPILQLICGEVEMIKLGAKLLLVATSVVIFSDLTRLRLNAAPIAANPAPVPIAQSMAKPSVSKSGNFVASEHPTTGMAQIVTVNGKRYLDFSQSFKTDQGPDLFVLLHRSSTPTAYKAGDYVSLGRLSRVSGSQRYAIPASVDLKNVRSVVIWCRQFNATFGYAKL